MGRHHVCLTTAECGSGLLAMKDESSIQATE